MKIVILDGYCENPGDLSWDALAALGISIDKTLANNDAYHALKACGGLIVTGPTGTNVNDITVLLV